MDPLVPRPGVLQVYVLVGLAIAVLGLVQHLTEETGAASPIVLVAALLCGGGVALLPRALLRSTLLVCACVASMVAVIGVPLFASFLATMITASTLARYAVLRSALLGFTALLLTVIAVAVPEVRASGDGVFGVVYPVVYFGGAGALGWLSRQRAHHVRSLEAVAASLERERHQQAELAAAAERERLARDMHDVISHGVSLMVVQAEAAGEVLNTSPDAAARALEAIADTGRSAMRELHSMLGVLHGSATDLDALSARLRATGVDVHLQVDPMWSTLAEPARTALFRVAQEAVTNVVRHAEGADAVSIRFSRTVETVTLEVTDNGDGVKSAGVGFGSGLQGLRERLRSVGGVLDAAPVGTGGFAVRATIPQEAA